jgi:hypothetical protein
MRSHDRHRVKSRLTAVNGLAPSMPGYRTGRRRSEAWVVDDVSLGGMGRRCRLGANDWVRIGALLGMQPEGGSNWLVGVIRRFSRETPTQGSVGIEPVENSRRPSPATWAAWTATPSCSTPCTRDTAG